MQARTATSDSNKMDDDNQKSQSRRSANVTFPLHGTSKTLGAASAQHNNVGSDSVKTNNKSVGSKRRANSNNTTDKKVNLDKFLSNVQQRSNQTPVSQYNGQRIAHLYKPSNANHTNHANNEEKSKVQHSG